MDWKAYFDSVFSDLFARRRLTMLVLCWLTGLLALFYYRALFAAEVCLAVPAPADFSVLEANETGPFVSWRRNALIEPQGDYKVEFDNLRAENGQLGFFGPASNETVFIDNLRVTFRRTESFDPWSDIRLEAFCDLFAPRRDELSGTGHIGVLSDLEGQALDYSVSVDTTNTTLVEIRNLNWEIRSADRTILKVQCRRAFLRHDAPYILLQGYATVTTPTVRLEANCIKMNAQDNCFVVDGPYLLTRDGRTDYGLAGCFDTALGPAGAAHRMGKCDTNGRTNIRFSKSATSPFRGLGHCLSRGPSILAPEPISFYWRRRPILPDSLCPFLAGFRVGP